MSVAATSCTLVPRGVSCGSLADSITAEEGSLPPPLAELANTKAGRRTAPVARWTYPGRTTSFTMRSSSKLSSAGGTPPLEWRSCRSSSNGSPTSALAGTIPAEASAVVMSFKADTTGGSSGLWSCRKDSKRARDSSDWTGRNNALSVFSKAKTSVCCEDRACCKSPRTSASRGRKLAAAAAAAMTSSSRDMRISTRAKRLKKSCCYSQLEPNPTKIQNTKSKTNLECRRCHECALVRLR